MSGICAVWRRDTPGPVTTTLSAIASGLSFSSEETVAVQTDRNAAVGASARFRTQQVYANARVLIACDADLYNEDELSRLIQMNEAPPPGARTAALMAAAYEKFGYAFLEKLQGAFSVLLWDRHDRKWLAAVDGFGIHRLAYYDDGNLFIAGSRIDALLRSGAVSREINPRTIANVLNFSANLAPDTAFANVSRIPPGSFLVVSDRSKHVEKYWDMRYDVKSESGKNALSRQLESVVRDSVNVHCKQDSFSELGAFLSGGTDSSTIVGMLSRMERGPVQAFSIGFQEQHFNELHYAELAAKAFGASHHTYLVGADDCLQALPQMVRCFDEPFGNSSAIPTYFCARLAAQNGVKTLLAGDGGDELFGGNSWYASDRIFELYGSIPKVLRTGLIEPVLDALPVQNGIVGKARKYVHRSNRPGLERVLSYNFLSAHSPAAVFDPGFLDKLTGYSVLDVPSRYYRNAPAQNHLERVLYTDVKIILGDSDLPKVTQMTELAGVQTRFPFLSRPVAEFSGLIPAKWKVNGFEKRYLFKRAFRNLLPAEILKKKKHGFGIPVATWLKSDSRMRQLAHDTLLSRRSLERGYFQPAFIEDLFRRHEADDSTYYGDILWTFLTLELWHHQAVDAPVGMTA